MDITHYQIHPALKGCVASIFTMSRNADENGEFVQTAIPSHECYLSFEFDTDFSVKNSITGVFSPTHQTTIIPPQLINTEISGKTIKAIMLKFKHAGFYRMFKVPIKQFNNECHNARDVFHREFVDLYDRMMGTAGLAAKVKVLESYLLKKVPTAEPYMPIDYAVERLLFNHGNIPIAGLASSACMSVRQLQRKFMERFGLSPKHFSKFIRFGNAYHMRNLFPELTWGQISTQCGYFDQMHLIHDFKSIAALNPCELDDKMSASAILLIPSTELLI